MKRFERLRRLTAHEASWRSAEIARTGLQRIAHHIRPPRWDRRQLADVLASDVAARISDKVRSGRWSDVHRNLADGIDARQAAFVIDPAAKAAVTDAVLSRWPDAASTAANRARRILDGHYDVLGYRGLVFADAGGDIDWHCDPVHNTRAPMQFWADVPYLDPAIGDHKIIWELNRHQHWLQLGRALWLTGEEEYGHAIVEQLESWLAANPPLTGINWASMLEIAFRSISWTAAVHFLLPFRIPDPGPRIPDPGSRVPSPNSSWLVDFFIGLDRQLTHVEQHLSHYFSPNTHLTGEALALYVVGTAFPELKRSARWIATGRQILLAEIDRQIGADGGHVERSTHYQRYTLDFYLLALLVARRANDADAIGRFQDAVARLADFTRAIADDSGQLPLIGDDDGGMLWPLMGRDCSDVRDSLAVASIALGDATLAVEEIPEEAFWIVGEQASVPNVPAPTGGLSGLALSCTLAQAGYWVGRDGHGGHLVFDVGDHGYLNAGHAHADALALTAVVRGRPLLIDPGTSTYTMDSQLRDRLRSSLCHNTVSIDGHSQSIPSGPFHWRTRTKARAHGWSNNAAFDWIEASHDGYSPVGHRRTVVRPASEGFIVIDEVLGSGVHAATMHWHFHPDWTPTARGPGRLRAEHLDGDEVWLLNDRGETQLVHGDEDSGLGWFAPAYGTLIPTWAAVCRTHGAAPFSSVTWLATAQDGVAPTLTRIAVEVEGCDAAVAACLTSGNRMSTLMVRPGRSSQDNAGPCGIGSYQTDARVFHFTAISEELAALDLVDASHALSLHEGWLSVAADEGISHLHAAIERGGLALTAAVPPAILRLQGSSLARATTVRLNGREASFTQVAAAETVILLADQWGDPTDRAIRRQREFIEPA